MMFRWNIYDNNNNNNVVKINKVYKNNLYLLVINFNIVLIWLVRGSFNYKNNMIWFNIYMPCVLQILFLCSEYMIESEYKWEVKYGLIELKMGIIRI